MINIRKSAWPRTDPCGTPDVTSCIEELVLFLIMHWYLLERYDCIHAIARESNLCSRSFCNKISWSTTSNAFRKSKKIAPVISPLSMLLSHLSKRLISAVLHEWFYRNPDCDLCKMLYLCKYANRCFVMCFSIIFDKTGSTEFGR